VSVVRAWLRHPLFWFYLVLGGLFALVLFFAAQEFGYFLAENLLFLTSLVLVFGVVAAVVTVAYKVRKLLQNPLSLAGIVMVLFFAAVAIAAPWLAPPLAPDARPDDPYRIAQCGYLPTPKPSKASDPIDGIIKIVTRQATICEVSPFGTTENQYDIYYGVVWGTHMAFFVGIIITFANVLIGITIGAISAYFGRWLDELLMRITDIFLAFPFLIAAVTMAAVLRAKFGSSGGLMIGVIALIVFGWMGYARLIRGDILSIREREYVLAVRAMGARDLRILLRHILPNAIYPTLVVASLDVGTYVLSFAALSFLGLGAEIGFADWGQMISFARNWIPNLYEFWYIVFWPGMAILFFVLGWNLIGDAFRDILDPRLKGRT
jgi:peptide/nickel transport system permease protein